MDFKNNRAYSYPGTVTVTWLYFPFLYEERELFGQFLGFSGVLVKYHTRGALLSFVTVRFSLVPFWISLSNPPRPDLMCGFGGTLSVDEFFSALEGGGAFLTGGVGISADDDD